MTHSIIYKIARALLDLPFALRRIRRSRIVMTLLVKNEEEMLAKHLEFHHAMGVDQFVITDNNSTDRTPEIIAAYKAKGWVAEVINEPSTDYSQKAWVDRMIETARTKCGADWIINADADEFWLPACGSFPELLKDARANVLAADIRNVLPEEGKPWCTWQSLINPVEDYKAYGLSPYSLFNRQTKKVLHRSRGYLQISMGNHKVSMLPHIERRAEITIFHFNVRGREQFMQKMINGGKQLEQHKGRHGGRHWRYFYKLYKEGKLAEEYDRVVGTHVRDRLLSEGYIYEDTRLRDFLEKLNAKER
ncbi:MAG: glycosyltransferase family 2 protein [Bacteroidales bacterium]|nr:glycosyltransferase family 2 protein [Bacteroidales bacterium]